MRSSVTKFQTLILLILGISLSPSAVLAQEATYTTTAVPTKGSLPGRVSLNLTFRINEWTTDQEVLELAEILREGGTDKLRGALEDIQKGRLSPQGRIGGDIAVARMRKTETGRDAGRIAGGAGIGALIGAIADGGKGAAKGAAIGAGVGTAVTLITRGREVELSAEQPFSFALKLPLEIFEQ